MLLSELFEELSYGELSDLTMSSVKGTIKEEEQPKIVIKLNDVLTNLYSKYVIKLEYAILNTTIKTTSYSLDPKNSVRIVYVEPEVEKEEDIYKNKDEFNVQGNTLIFKKAPVANSFAVRYQWKPSRLKISPTEPRFLDQRIPLDPVLLPLVRTQVAAGIFQNMNGEAHKNTGVNLQNQAQLLISDLEISGILNNSVDFENNRFRINNFT